MVIIFINFVWQQLLEVNEATSGEHASFTHIEFTPLSNEGGMMFNISNYFFFSYGFHLVMANLVVSFGVL